MKINLLLTIILLLPAMYVRADIENGLDNMFVLTGNEPQIYQSQRRSGFASGTLRLRAPISTYQVVNLSPPSLRSGCGGIDMYGGSFTFINAEQFRQMLRQIGANALGYAFKLALSSMCDSCEQTLTGLQDMVQNLNKMQVDTCKWAKGFVNDAAKALPGTFKEEDKLNETAIGTFSDGFAAITDMFTNPEDSVSGGNAEGADPAKRDRVGNFTWNAVREYNAGANMAFTPGNIDNNELLMNIAGTFIFGETATEEMNPFIEARITYEELKYGKRATSDGAADAKPVLECNSDPDNLCMKPVAVAQWSFGGVSNWAEGLLQQAANHMANPATAGTAHPPLLQGFLATAPLSVTRHMLHLQGDQDALNMYVQHIKEYFSAVYTSTFALAMSDMIRLAYENEDTPKLLEKIDDNLAEFERQAKTDQLSVQKQYSAIWLETEELVAALSNGRGYSGVLVKEK